VEGQLANDVSRNPIYVDTAGVVTEKPLWIKKIVLVPTATTSAATIKYWEEDEDSVRAHKRDATATGTDSNTLTSTGNFEVTTEAVNQDVIHIYASSTGNNIGWWSIENRADNAVDVLPTTLTTESNKVYSWKTYATYPFASMATATFPPQDLDFGPEGIKVPNLSVPVLTTGVLYIYL
jgi:hypothetical protein